MTNLNHRLTRLEQILASQRCRCPNSADLAWPGHNPPSNCPHCGGERPIHQLEHDPGSAEHLIRDVPPLMAKTYNGTNRPDLSKLTDHELPASQTRTPRRRPEQPNLKLNPPTARSLDGFACDFENRCSIH